MFILACGMCVYYSLQYIFPPITSWSVIFPVWLLALSGWKEISVATVRYVPPFLISLVLVILVFLFAPAVIGPPLGVWIPVCCIAATLAVFSKPKEPNRRPVFVIGAIAVVCLLAFGGYDYVRYYSLSPDERAAKLPPHLPRAKRPISGDRQ